jgi:hypothetical protein
MIGIERFLQKLLEQRTRHHRVVVGEVRVGYPDGTFDVSLDEGGSVLGATPSPGIPALEVQAEENTRCLVAWQDGDPSKPRIVAWADTGIRRVSITGTRPVARLGDTVEVMLPGTINVAGFLKAGGEVVPPLPASPFLLPEDTPFSAVVITEAPTGVIGAGKAELTS